MTPKARIANAKKYLPDLWRSCIKRLINQIILHGKENQSGRVFGAEPFHEPVFNGFNGAGTYFQLLRDLLGSKFHANVFDYFAFTFTECDFGIEVGNYFGA